VAEEVGLPFEAVELPGMVEADVIITITSSFAPTLLAEHVSPGTHLACMGTDTKGKQEVEAALLGRATVFCDEVAQSVSIGEAQHAVAEGLIAEGDIVQVGAVINGTHGGRASDEEITLFDGTGVGLQDLAVSDAIVKPSRPWRRARRRSCVTKALRGGRPDALTSDGERILPHFSSRMQLIRLETSMRTFLQAYHAGRPAYFPGKMKGMTGIG
jgi:hypothetical protein